MDKLAVVFGGSGFLGRQVVRELCRQGWRVRVAVRRAHQAIDLRVEGSVGQVQLMQCNIRSERSIAQAIVGADTVINLVGVLTESGPQKFASLHARGAGLIAQAAAAIGARQLIHVSAIGADDSSDSAYARSKAKGEENVRAAFADAVILRPSVIFGSGDGLFERFAAMARLTPVLPLPKAASKMQPVFVGDVARALGKVLNLPSAAGKVYELGGPEVLTLGQIFEFTVREIDRKRIVVPMWDIGAKAFGVAGDIIGWIPFVTPFITSDQVKLLDADNVVDADALGFAELGMDRLETIEAIVPSYLGRFRQYGQFHEKSPV
jgi:NADH dehydrogenase